MEIPTPPVTKPRSRLTIRLFIGVIALLLLLWLYYMVMSVLAARHWVQEINYELSQNSKLTAEQTIKNEALVDVQKRIAFTRARLAAANTDSITLAIIVPDRLLVLEISGVNVSSVKVEELKISRSLQALEHMVLINMLSKPLRINHNLSTIPKEPIIEITAPRNADEASQAEHITPDFNADPVFFEITTDHGIKILFLQEVTDRNERIQHRRFILRRALAKTSDNLSKIVRFEVPAYHPQILITLPVNDARAIYRALPERGVVTLLM